MNNAQHIHDGFFKELFGLPEIAADFMRFYLPDEIVAALDLSVPPEPVRENFIDEELQRHFADLVYQVRLREGATAYLCVLLEHKSAPDKWVALQILRYQTQLWTRLQAEGAKALPPIYPVVLYHGSRRWKIKRNFQALVTLRKDSLFAKYVPEFEYHLLDLTTLDETNLRGAAYLQAGLYSLSNVFAEEGVNEKLTEALRLLTSDTEAQRKKRDVTILTYFANARDELTGKELARSYQQVFPERKEGMNAIEQLRHEGFKKGMRQGRQEGLLSMTLRQLQAQIGKLPKRVQTEIKALPATQLEELGEALLRFSTLPELENWLRQHQTQH